MPKHAQLPCLVIRKRMESPTRRVNKSTFRGEIMELALEIKLKV